MGKIKRKHYLVDKDMQFHYIALIVIPLVTLLAALYYLMYYSVLSQILIPEAILSMLLPAMKKINIVVAITGPVILFLILRTALIYSNRIIGPIPRIKKELDKVISGDYSLRLKVRDRDTLKSLVDKINLLLDKVDKERRAR